MSFDLMVFDPDAVPLDREGFLAWYKRLFDVEENDRGEGLVFDEPSVCTPPLRAWFFEMIQRFPAMNGPHASEEDVPELKLAQYDMARASIYVGFRWSEAGSAYEAMFELAKKHKVGFFDVSANDGQVWVPDPNGDYICLHGV